MTARTALRGSSGYALLAFGFPLLLAGSVMLAGHAPSLPLPAAKSSDALSSAPAGLRLAASSTLGAANAKYFVVRRNGALVANGGGMTTVFGSSGPTIHIGNASLGLTFAASASAPPVAHRNNVTYQRPGVTEWYRNGLFGLEQGFTLARRPKGSSRDWVTLAVRASGPLPLSQRGTAIVATRGGSVVARYGNLSAVDAAGKSVRTRLSLRGHTILLQVRDRGARYPLTIDPFVQVGTKLTVTTPGEVGNPNFGENVAISADGSTAAFGGPNDDNSAGAVWIFVQRGGTWSGLGDNRVETGGVWSQQGSKLTPSDAVGPAQFGAPVSLSRNGDTLLAGGGSDDSLNGAAWVFTRTNGSWSQQAKLTVVDVDEVGAADFGAALSLSNDGKIALIGGSNDNVGRGAAWVFTFDDTHTTWTESTKLTGGSEIGAGLFGASVALSGDGTTALIGGFADGGSSGAVWAFTRSGAQWTERQKLTDANPGDAFGFSVALSRDGNEGLIGAPNRTPAGIAQAGAVFPMKRSPTGTWLSDGAEVDGIVATEGLGTAVAISADGLVGAAGPSDPSTSTTIITKAPGNTSWGYDTQITKAGGIAGSSGTLAFSGDGTTFIGGAPRDGNGVAWVYNNDSGGWHANGHGPLHAALQNEDAFAGQFGFGFGSSVAVSRDGTTAIVGSPLDDGGEGNNPGSAYVFTNTGGVWTQQGGKLTPADGTGTERFGTSVALSDDGNTALIGGASLDTDPAGVWVFTREGGNWTQQGPKLVGNDWVPGPGYLPIQVAVSGDGNTALIGSPGDQQEQGAVWVFTRDAAGTWTQQGPKMTHGLSRFGTSVALSENGTTALIGTNTEAAYVLTQSNGTWSTQATLTQSNINGSTYLGYSVALSADGNTALVGGAHQDGAWVYTRSGVSWSDATMLTPNDGTPDGVALSSLFGWSVALSSDGTTAVIGGYLDGPNSSQIGATWAFTRPPGGSWSQQGPKLTPSDNLGSGGMGAAVAVSGDGSTIFSGQPNQQSGAAAWIFTRDGGTWARTQSVNGRGSEEGLSGLGTSIAMSGDGLTAIVGAPGDDSNVGAAWVFVQSNGVWSRQGPKLSPSDQVGSPRFGTSVALSENGDIALIGGPNGGGFTGNAWIFKRTNGHWLQSGPGFDAGTAVQQFGTAVALSPDGTTALVGAPGGIFEGAAYVLTSSGDTWSVDATLTPSDAGTGIAHFGSSVALSADAKTAIVGGPSDNSLDGAAWVFARKDLAGIGPTWLQLGHKLQPSDWDITAGATVQFGFSVALSADGSSAAIGGPDDSGQVGAAWAFGRVGDLWSQDGNKLVPSDVGGALLPRFGASVAMSSDGTRLVIGGPQASTGIGAIWQFDRSNGLWGQQGPKVVSDDGSPTNVQNFGTAVALSTDGQVALIGGPNEANPGRGAVWVFSQAAKAPPGRPFDVQAHSRDGAAEVQFSTPFSDGNSPITSYTVTASPGGATATGSSSPITVTGLANGTIYTFTVTATNAIGDGLPSAPSNPVIPFGPTTATLTAEPSSIEAGAEWVEPKDVPTTSIPMQMLAQAVAPLSDIGLAGSPLSDIPLSDIGLAGSASALTKMPLSKLPLVTGTWQQLLAGTPLASAPLQTVTFGQALQANPAVAAITLSKIDLSNSPLSDIGLAAVVLGGVPLSDIPLQKVTGGADALTAWCHAFSGPPIKCASPTSLTGDTLMSLALEGAPLSDIPLSDILLSDIPLSIPLSDIPLSDIAIAGSPLSDIPLSDISTPSNFVDCPAKVNCSTATIGDAAAAGAIRPNVLYGDFAKAVPLSDIPLSDIPLSDIPLSDISLTPNMITSSPLSDIPLSDIPLSDIGTIINCAIAPATTCTASRSGTLGSVASAIRGTLADIARLRLSSTPLSDIPLSDIALTPSMITGSPLSDIPLSDIPLSDIATIINCAIAPPTTCTASRSGTLGSVADAIQGNFGDLVRAIPLSDIPLSDIPLSDIPLSDIKLSVANISDSPLSDVKLSDLPLSDIGTVIDCASFNSYCAPGSTATLGDVAASKAFKADATLADLARILPPTTRFGDLLVAMINPNTFPWEKLPYADDSMQTQTFAGAGGVLPYTLEFKAPATTTTTNVIVSLPPGALYMSGSSQLDQLTGGGTSTSPEPGVNGTQLSWTLSSLASGETYQLRFQAHTPLKLGFAETTATVGGAAAAPVAVNITETNTDNASPLTATSLAEKRVYFGYIGAPGESHYFVVPAPATLGSRVIVRLSNPSSDTDLVVYTPAGQQVRFAGGIPLTSPPTDDSTTGAQPAIAQDVDIPSVNGDVVGGVSASRGTAPETVTLNSTGVGGQYLIKVSGYNAASSPLPFTLRVETDTPPAPPSGCNPRVLSGGVAHPIPATSSLPSNLNTLFLVDSKRIGDEFGTDAEQQVWDKLTALAGQNNLGVSGAVIPVEGDTPTQNAYNAWDGNPCSPLLANDVANSIGALVDRYYGLHSTTLKYVVIVGADDIVPMQRVPDNAQDANEHDFAPAFAGGSNNEYYGALSNRFLLSDAPYGTTYPITGPFRRSIYVPNLSVGRLVETPNEIIGAIDRFQAPTVNGALDPTSALTTGYDFLADGATAIANQLDSFASLSSRTRLINETWTHADLDAAIRQFPGIVSLNAHFDTARSLPAIGNKTKNETDLFTIDDINALPTGRLAGGIWFSMGCHSGLDISDVVVGPSSPIAGDWAQTLEGQQGVVYGANSGFGYGDTAGVLYSERLMALFAQGLDGSLSVGQAWQQAIRTYWLTLGNVSVYDEKVMEEATFYGLPFYGVGHSPLPVFSTRAASRTATSASSLALPVSPLAGVGSVPFTFHPGFTPHTTASGKYYEGDNGVSAVVGQPIVPVSARNATVPGEVAHGVLITTPLDSADEQDFPVAFSQPVIDTSGGEAAAPTPDASFPSAIASLRSFGSPTDPQQTAIFATGAFFSGPKPGSGVMRRWMTISGETLYSPSSDFTPPTILSASATTDGSHVTFSVDASDPDKQHDNVGFVYVVYHDVAGTWQSATLAQDAHGLWTGTAPATGDQVRFFVQAGDTHGNIAVSSNKADYFAARGVATIALNGTTDSNGLYIGPVHVSAASSVGSPLQYSLDGDAPTDYAGAFTVSANGPHTVTVTAADGSEDTKAFALRGAAPLIAITTPAADATYLRGTHVSAAYTCSDQGSGVSSCAGPVASGNNIDTTTIGVKTFTVDSTDSSGISSSQTVSYSVYAPVPLSPPTLNVPATSLTAAVSVSGAGKAGASVNVLEGTTTVGGATVGTGGSWSTVVTLPAGFHTLRATQTLDGQTSAASNPATVRVRLLINATASNWSGVEGASRTATLATFSVSNLFAAATGYRATINWGDGAATEPGTIAATGPGTFAITGSHAYQEEGSFAIQVTIIDRTDPSTSATVTPSAAIADAPLTAAAPTFAPSLQSFNGTVATFNDVNPAGPIADFTAQINWGDNQTSNGSLLQTGAGFTVLGSHTYSGTGYYTITTTITDRGGSTVRTSARVLVYAFPAGGAFAIGDRNTGTVTFWGSQWSKANSLSRGSAPSSFKGFVLTGNPACNSSWTTGTGASPVPPPAPLPAYMGVIVTSQTGQSGSAITGNAVHIVVVQTNGGYNATPSTPGTGTVVATIC